MKKKQKREKLPKLLKQLEQLHFVRDIFPVCLSAIPNKITCSQFHVGSTQIPRLDELMDPVTKILCLRLLINDVVYVISFSVFHTEVNSEYWSQ